MAGNLRRIGPLQLASPSGAPTGFIGADTGDNVAQSLGITGRVVAIQYVPDGTNPYTNAFGTTITAENSGTNILTVASTSAAFLKYPLAPAAKAADGTASTLSEVQVPLFNERIKIVLSSAGTATTGQWFAYVE